MTIILGDSLVKYLKGLELSDKNNKVVTKHFSGATTNDSKLYIQPMISNNPEYILLHWYKRPKPRHLVQLILRRRCSGML